MNRNFLHMNRNFLHMNLNSVHMIAVVIMLLLICVVTKRQGIAKLIDTLCYLLDYGNVSGDVQ